VIEMGWAGGRLAGPSRCPHRVVFGQGRVVHCRDGGEVTVSTSCVQFSDGSIDIGGLIETPAVQIDRRHSAAMLGNSRRQSSDPPLSRRVGAAMTTTERHPIPRAAGVELLFQVLTEREERSVIAIAPTSHSLPGQRHSLTRDCALRLLTC
jgi:hypothetical protein